jgi:cytochrome c5
MAKTPWVIVYDATGAHGHSPYTMECQRCHQVYVPPIPMAVDMFARSARRFQRDHASCKEKETP